MIDQRVMKEKKLIFLISQHSLLHYRHNFSSKFNLDIIPVYIERDIKNGFKVEFQKKLHPKNFKIKQN